MISVCKIFRFEAAHSISNHPGKCRNIHGHSYELHVRVTAADLNDQDMIIDFAELKKCINHSVINPLDHCLLLAKKGELSAKFKDYEGKLIWLDKEPTAEYMLLTIKNWIVQELPKGIQLRQLQLWETKNSYAQWDSEEF